MKRSKFLNQWSVLLLLIPGLPVFGSAMNPVEGASIRREPLAKGEWSEFRTLVTLHRMPVTPATSCRNNRMMPYRYDETLFSPDATILDELNVAEEMGLAGVCQETGMGGFFRAGADLDGILIANMAPLMLARYGTTLTDPEGIARYLESVLDEANSYPDQVMKIDGKTVLMIFNSWQVDAALWPKIRDLIETDERPLFMMHHAFVHRPGSDFHRNYLEKSFDGAFIWGGSPELKSATADMLLDLRTKMVIAGLNEFPIMMTADPGYWRPELGWWWSRRGTADFRDAVRYVFDKKLGWMLYESWDDYGENTLIQPSIRNHTTLMELAAFYTHLGHGELWSATAPGLLSAHPAEILRGRSCEVEVLQLPVDGQAAVPVFLKVRNGRGEVIFSSEDLRLDPARPEAVTVTLPGTLSAQNHVLRPEVVRDGVTMMTSSYITVRENRLHDMHQYQLEAARLIQPEKLEFTINGKQMGEQPMVCNGGTALVHVVSSELLRRIELVRNSRVVRSVDTLQKDGAGTHTLAMFWDAPVTIKGERYYFSGRMTIENGEVLRGSIDRMGAEMKIAPDNTIANWQIPGNALHGAASIVFKGDDNTRLNFVIPGLGKEFSYTWGELKSAKASVELPLTAHSVFRLEPTEIPSGLPETLDLKEGTFSFELPEEGEFPVDAYHVRLIGDDFRLARSAPVLVGTEKIGAKEETTTWTFDSADGRIEPDVEGLGYNVWLGGEFNRNGGYEPTRVPLREDGALVFDGVDDIASLSPNLLPQAGSRIQIRVCPERIPYTTEQVILGGSTFQLSLAADGKIHASFKKTAVRSSSALKQGKWADVELVHDGHRLALLIDGQEEASVALERIRTGVSHKPYLGALRLEAQLAVPQSAFAGRIDSIKISTPRNGNSL